MLSLHFAKAVEAPNGSSNSSTNSSGITANQKSNPLGLPSDVNEDSLSDTATPKKDSSQKNDNEPVPETNSQPQKKVNFIDKNAVRGLWLGATLYSQNFSTTAKATISGTARDIKSRTADIENLGFTAEYMHMPYNSIGSSFSGTVATSLNHASLNYSMIISLNLQVNLTYAKQFSDKTPYYFFGGLGYETLSGSDINNLVAMGGVAYQGGAGIILARDFSLEGYYQIIHHKLSSTYLDNLSKFLTAQGATSVSFDSSSEATSNVIAARLTYRY